MRQVSLDELKDSLLCLLTCLAVSKAEATPAHQYIVKICQLGPGAAHIIQAAREQEIAASYIYTFSYGGKPHYFFDSQDASRGLSMHIACAGRKRRALVAYGEFTANFLRGFVIVLSPQTGEFHRLDFVERSPPQWIYMGKDETLAIFPTNGIGEYGNKKYIVYRRANRAGAEAGIRGANVLPPSTGFDIAQLEE
jgi:hypothetical protein